MEANPKDYIDKNGYYCHFCGRKLFAIGKTSTITNCTIYCRTCKETVKVKNIKNGKITVKKK